ncbi:cupin domain-containing protein [Paraburkholderia strydomiana]|uniref:cupin domain-containing protein n=1 Tax=Paraburkholderia strydomiana TaxID=1245417 RepID=UPI0038BA26B5
MERKRAGSQPLVTGPGQWLTGTVRIDPLKASPPAHPLGQTLIATAGCRWTQCESKARMEIRAGDVIWCRPSHKHGHGARSTTSLTHIAIQEALDGKNAHWLKKVTDEQSLSSGVPSSRAPVRPGTRTPSGRR